LGRRGLRASVQTNPFTSNVRSDNLIFMPDISATEAARRFSDVLDSIEHDKARYTIIRRGKAVASLEPMSTGRGADVKGMLRRHDVDKRWAADLRELRDLIEIDVR
jgi:antitoxin (DNA-binding transcriptional repressor) of toxin-antitoxin stability system